MDNRSNKFENLSTPTKKAKRLAKSDEEFYELVGKISSLMAQLSPPDKLKALRVLAFGENQFAGSLSFPTPARGGGVMPCTSTSLEAAGQTTIPKRPTKRTRLAKPLRKSSEYTALANTLKSVKKQIRARKAELKELGTDPSTDDRLKTLVEESHTAVRRKQALRNELGVKPGPKSKQKGPSSMKDVKSTDAKAESSADESMVQDHDIVEDDTSREPEATGADANPFAGSKRGKASDGNQPKRSSKTKRKGSE